MGIEPSSVNVSDLTITRPGRRGVGGDESGSTTLGADLSACFVSEDKLFRRPGGREIASIGRFFVSPWRGADGEIVAIKPGDLAEWTDLLGVTHEPQEIIAVDPTSDCDGNLDVVAFRIGVN